MLGASAFHPLDERPAPRRELEADDAPVLGVGAPHDELSPGHAVGERGGCREADAESVAELGDPDVAALQDRERAQLGEGQIGVAPAWPSTGHDRLPLLEEALDL